MALNKKKIIKFIKIISAVTCAVFCGLKVAARITRNDSIYENELNQKNPLEGHKVIFVKNEKDVENADGVCGHLESVGLSDYKPGIYEKYFKRAIDVEKFIQDYYRNTGQKWKWYAVIRLLTERRLRYLLYFRVLQENKLKFFWPFCWGGVTLFLDFQE